VSDSFENSGKTACGGGLQCDSVRNAGVLEVGGGGLQCDSVRNAGVLEVGGGVVADSVANSGMMTIEGGIEADLVKNSGELTIGGGIAADEFRSSGAIALGGGLKADTIGFSGTFQIGGGISANGSSATGITITLPDADCSARYVTAKSLIVKKSVNRPCSIVKLGEIRADHAELENVHADFAAIKAGRVGDGCCIARLECGAGVEILPGAEVIRN